MSDLSDERALIQVEETQFRYAISESLLQKVGKSINFILNRNHQEKQFFINGNTAVITTPATNIDGLTFFQYDATILDAWMFVQTAGSGGTTELDIKYASSSGGAFSSIFSTTPKIQSGAGSGVWVHVGSAIASTTAPVLSTTNVVAGGALRLDIISSQTGTPNGCGVVIHYRPR